MTPRRRQREFALEILYSLYFDPAVSKESLIRSFENFQTETEELDGGIGEQREGTYAWTLTEGVFDHEKELDAIIVRHSKFWKLNRIARVDLTILRLCLYELLYSDVPPNVIINEGIELAKDFSDTGSGTFINGILDAASKDEHLRR